MSKFDTNSQEKSAVSEKKEVVNWKKEKKKLINKL